MELKFMKVLKQDWESSRGSEHTSLSRDVGALDEMKCEVVSEDEDLMPVGDMQEITIPDNSAIAEMVEHNGTIFLNNDELHIVFDSPEYQ